jgi:hypothetical protein
LVKIEKVPGPHLAVMSERVMFSEIVRQIVSAAAPVDKELALGNAVSDQVEAHVDGFGAALFYSVVGNTRGTGVVALDGSDCLWMPHLGEGGPEPDNIFGVVEEGTKFSFGCRVDKSFDDEAVDMNGTIAGRRGRVGTGEPVGSVARLD